MRLSPASFLILIAFLLLPLQLAKADEVFEKWLSALRADALAAGISEQTVATALSNVELREKVVKYDRNQPEFKLTYERYMRNVVPASRVQEGKQKWADNEALLNKHLFRTPTATDASSGGAGNDTSLATSTSRFNESSEYDFTLDFENQNHNFDFYLKYSLPQNQNYKF